MSEGGNSHVDHVGSLVRPAAVLAAFDAFEDGTLDAAAFRRVQDAAIAEAVARQEAVGLPFATDGEFRRRSYNRGMIGCIEGMGQRPTPYAFRSLDGRRVAVNAGYFEGHLSRRRPIVADDFAFLNSVARGGAKVTMPAPSYFHFGLFDQCFDPSVHADVDEAFAELIAIYREEIADLAAAGCTMVQLDDTALALICDPENQAVARERGHEPEALVAFYVGLVNAIADACPPGMKLRLHLCRGNRVGMWAASGGYEPVAEQVFGEARVDGFLLEFDSERAGGFEPLRHLPKGRTAFLGLMSTKRPEIEPADRLRAGIDAAARFAPAERLGLCPQCGFGASALRGAAGENPMNEDIQARKLARLVEVADTVWGRA